MRRSRIWIRSLWHSLVAACAMITPGTYPSKVVVAQLWSENRVLNVSSGLDYKRGSCSFWVLDMGRVSEVAREDT